MSTVPSSTTFCGFGLSPVRTRSSARAVMKELAADIAIVIGPAGLVYWALGDPWISALWAFVGLTVRWYQRRSQQPACGKGDERATMRHNDAAE
jgi:hypothetical protein